MIQFIDKLEVQAGFQSDHSIVESYFSFNSEKHGPGYWKLNVTLLKDQDYVKKMNKLINIELENEEYDSKRKKWEGLKLAARGTTVQYAARKQKLNRKKLQVLERTLKKLERETKSAGGVILARNTGNTGAHEN